MEKAREIAAWFHKVFGDRYFIEIQNNGLEIQRMAMEGAIDLASRMGLPLVATSDVHYVIREDAEAQDVLLCINTGKFRTDTNRMRMESNEFYLRSPEEMYAAFPGYDEAAEAQPADRRRRGHRPGTGQAALPRLRRRRTARPPHDFLRELCLAGLKERYAGRSRAAGRTASLSAEVMARLERELDVINKLGFANYFLIVWDFVRFARAQRHPGHGPRIGRRLAGVLCAVSEPRLPAEIRPAVRAVPRREPAARRPISTSTSARIAAAR